MWVQQETTAPVATKGKKGKKSVSESDNALSIVEQRNFDHHTDEITSLSVHPTGRVYLVVC